MEYYVVVTTTYPVARKYRHVSISGPYESRFIASFEIDRRLADSEWFLNHDGAESVHAKITEGYPKIRE